MLLVGTDVAGINENDFERVIAYVAERLHPAWVPAKLAKMEINNK